MTIIMVAIGRQIAVMKSNIAEMTIPSINRKAPALTSIAKVVMIKDAGMSKIVCAG